MAASKLRLKLMVDKKAQKVLFAEAGKKVVDFLFYLLALPIGTVIKLLTKDCMVGSLSNVYKSVEDLGETYMKSNKTKISLLEPKIPTDVAQVLLLLSNPSSPTPDNGTVQYYTCNNNQKTENFPRSYGSNYHNYVSENNRSLCPACNRQMTLQMTCVAGTETAEEKPSGDGGGYVKGLVTYMVMDDLSVTPMSTISGITLLNKFNVRELGSLEEEEVDFSMDEGLALLKASLQSKTVLTDVFLAKKLKRPHKKRSAR